MRTVCTDSVFITPAIKATENHCTGVVDLPSAYLSADMDGKAEVILVMQGDLAETTTLTPPEVYHRNVSITTDRKKSFT